MMKKTASLLFAAVFFLAGIFSLAAFFPGSLIAQTLAVPAAPTGVVVIPGPGLQQATVTYNFDPLDTAGTDVYTATVSPASISPVTATGFGQLVLNGLPNGTYSVTVTAKNASGTSPASAPASLVMNSSGTTTAGATAGAILTTPTSSAVSGLSFQLSNPLGSTSDLPTFLYNILNAVVLLLTPVVVLMMIYAGFLFVTAQGNVEKLGDAKKALLYTLIGAAIVLGAKGFATIIANTVACLAGTSC